MLPHKSFDYSFFVAHMILGEVVCTYVANYVFQARWLLYECMCASMRFAGASTPTWMLTSPNTCTNTFIHIAAAWCWWIHGLRPGHQKFHMQPCYMLPHGSCAVMHCCMTTSYVGAQFPNSEAQFPHRTHISPQISSARAPLRHMYPNR